MTEPAATTGVDSMSPNPETGHPKQQPAARTKGALWEFRAFGVRSIAVRTWQSVSEDDVSGRSAQLAYYFFFALFPGLIAMSSLVGLAVSSASATYDKLLNYMAAVIPPSAFAIVADTFHQTAHASTGSKVILGGVLALWSASAGTSAVQDALNSVYKVKEGRPFWRARLSAIALTIITAVLFSLALAALFFGDALSSLLALHLGFGSFFMVVTRVLSWPIAFCFVGLAFAVVYYMAPDVEQPEWRWVTPGAALSILLWVASSLGLRVYLHFFNSYSVTYGSLGAVIVLLTWFYLSGFMLLLGAEINGAIEGLAADAGEPDAKPAGEKVPQLRSA